MIAAAKLTRLSEDEARTLLEQIRWPLGPVCMKCGSINTHRMGGKAGAKGQIKCRDCRGKFTIRLGTIFEDSPLPLRDWVYCIARMASSKKSISAHQIHRELGVTYQTAWFMCHRVRHAMRDDGTITMTDIVESDEAYIGGKPRRIAGKGRIGQKPGVTNKVPVHVLVERGGRKRTRVVANVTAATLRKNIKEMVDENAEIHTDEGGANVSLGKELKAHKMVDHGAYEYVRKEGNTIVTTNTAESSFALIKRGVYGTFHHISAKHLQRYCDEYDFRWDHRGVNDVDRAIQAIKQTEGKRLTYRRASAT